MKKRWCVLLLTLVLLIGCMPLPGSAAESVDFADLKGHWAREYVLPLAQDGVISGKSAGVFDPESNITRAEFITLVANLTNLHEDEESPYADVSANAWFAKTISAAKAYGVIDDTMTADGNFYPDTPITREEMTSVVVRLAEKIRGTLLNTKSGFSDEAGFGDWAKDYIAKAAGEGIVTGNTDGTFNAKGNATRAEAAVIIKRFRDLLNQPVRTLQAGEYHPVYDAVIYEVDLQKMIEDAYASGQKTLTLEKGAYRVNPTRNCHLKLSGMKDFTIDGNGSTMLCQSPNGQGLIIENCENVVVKNFNIDYELLTMWQARIIAIDKENLSFDVEIPLGYRDYFEKKTGFLDEIHTQVYKADGSSNLSVPHNQFLYFSKMEKIGERKYRVKAGSLMQYDLEVGDILAGGNRGVTKGCVGINNSKECQLINFGAWGGSVGIGMTGGYGGHRLDNFRVEPGPRPLGAIEDRVMSSVADAAHIQLLEVGPTIENSRFAGSGDDGFNCYGTYSCLAERVSDTEYIIALSANAKNYTEVGNTLRFYSLKNALEGSAVISSMEILEGYQPKESLKTDMGVATFEPAAYARVKLASAVKNATVGGLITNASHNCNGFVIRNTVYENIRPRAILAKGSDGLIEGNTIRNCAGGGIVLGPEAHWLESDYVRNVTVKNNTIDACGYGGFASIRVVGSGSPENRNIVIEGNTISNSFYEDMKLTDVAGITIKNNTILDPHENVKAGSPSIYIDQVDGAVLSGNVWKTDRKNIEVTANAKDIQK